MGICLQFLPAWLLLLLLLLPVACCVLRAGPGLGYWLVFLRAESSGAELRAERGHMPHVTCGVSACKSERRALG